MTRTGRVRVVKNAGLVLGAGVVLSGVAGVAAAGGEEKPAVAVTAPQPSARAASSGAATPAPAAVRERLVGVWRLNPELSEDPRAKMREGGGHGPGGGPGGGGEGGPGGGGPGGGGPGGGGPGGGGPPPGGGGRGGGPPGGGGGGGGWSGDGGHGGRGMAGGPEGGPRGPGGADLVPPIAFEDQLTVTNLEPEITMIDAEGGIRRLHADGRSYKDSNGFEVKTRWEESALVVETKTGRERTRETWSVADAPRRLTVVVKADRPFGGEVTVRRVFDATTVEAARKPEPPR